MSARSRFADRFNDSLHEATQVVPLDAELGVSSAHVHAAVARTGAQHWVNQLPTRAQDARLHGMAVERPGQLSVDLLSRRSALDATQPSEERALELLLVMAATHAKTVDAAGRPWSSRIAPSSGGTHCIRPLLYCDGAWYRADICASAIEEVIVAGDELLRDSEAALRAPLQAGLFAVAEPDILAARYPEGSSLLWRDAGAFLAVAQLAALALDVQARIIGSTTILESVDRAVPAAALGVLALGGGPS